MNYEQKYKEALERAGKELQEYVHKDCDDMTRRTAITIIHNLFPELKESEDERIRKMLRAYIHDFGVPKEYFGDVENSDVLAWLEKQGEKSICISERNDVVKCLINGMKFYYEDNKEATWGTEKFSMKVKDILSWLEKQGEPNPYSGTSFEYNGHIWGICARDNGVEILFDGELKAFLSLEKSFIYPIYPKLAHKSAIEAIKDNVGSNNKVKPKFHEGDWIGGYYTNYKVLSVNNVGYLVEDTDGNKINILFENEKFHHLFTIADAKDGDVLVDEDNNIGLYSGEKDDLYWHSYIYLGCDDYLRGIRGYHNHKNTKPATKEQRDLLFQKMREAGYEWDDEKKELKKIEHKMLDADEVIAWLVANILDFEDKVKLFKKDFEL